MKCAEIVLMLFPFPQSFVSFDLFTPHFRKRNRKKNQDNREWWWSRFGSFLDLCHDGLNLFCVSESAIDHSDGESDQFSVW